MIEIRVLGRFAVQIDGVAVPSGTPREAALLVQLALASGRALRRDRLVDDLWDGEPPSTAANKVQIYVSALRKRLGRGVIRTVPDGYALGRDVDVDVLDWRQLVRHALALADDGDDIGALASFSLAEQHWAEPFEGLLRTPSLRAEHDALTTLRLDAAVRRSALRIEQGHLPAVIADLTELVESHPMHEGLVAQLVLATAATGRRLDALQLHDTARRMLAEEYGLDPGPALVAAHERVLRDDVPMPPVSDRPAIRLGLPHLPDVLIGRAAELAELCALVAEPAVRLVTVTGIGGVGKTRLGQALVQRHPTAAWVTLVAAQAPSEVPEAIASQLGIEAVGGSAAEQVLATLAAARMELLLVIDDFERFHGAERFIERLLLEVPDVTICITSRRPLGIPAERRFVVEPLSLDDGASSAAAELFRHHLDRLGVAGSRTDATAVEIVRLCGGLPLAIELAAARARVLDLVHVRDRLAASLHDSTSESPVAAAVRWSVDALSDSARRTWLAASVFVGGCTAEALAAVAGTSFETVLDDLEAALDLNLIRAERGPGVVRFVLLPVIARMAAAALAPADGAALRDAHAAWFATLIGARRPSEYFPTSLDQLGLLAGERANIRAAVRRLADGDDVEVLARMVVQLSTPWRVFGEGAEMLAWIDALLSRDGLSTVLRSDLLVVRDRTTGLAGGADGDVLLDAAADLLVERPDPERAAVVLLQQGYHALLAGRDAAAAALLEEVDRLTEHVHPSFLVGVEQLRAMLDAGRGLAEAAAVRLRAVHDDARRRGYDFLSLELTGNLAELLIEAARYDDAAVVALEGLAASRSDDRFTRTLLLVRIAIARMLDGRITLANDSVRTALALSADTTWTRDKLSLLLVCAADLAFVGRSMHDAAYLLGVWRAGLDGLGVRASSGEEQLVDRYLQRIVTAPTDGPTGRAVAEACTEVARVGVALVVERAVQALLDRRAVHPGVPVAAGADEG